MNSLTAQAEKLLQEMHSDLPSAIRGNNTARLRVNRSFRAMKSLMKTINDEAKQAAKQKKVLREANRKG